ncbi:MAG: SURF1 family cytochrome oxidase biogenesis protein [Pseudomonadota bacterium]
MIKKIATVALIFAALAALLALGTWQVQRLAWKEDLIAQSEVRPLLAPVPLDELVAETGLSHRLSIDYDDQDIALDAAVYRRVTMDGEFFGDTIRVFTTLSDTRGVFEGPGYWLLQGFQTDQHVVFVNRGFRPFELPQGVLVARAPEGTVALEGIVRPDETPSFLDLDPDYNEQLLYRRNVSQLMQATGVSVALPITIDLPAGDPGQLPQAGETKFEFSNRHLGYAITWYGLAATLVGVVGISWWRRRQGGALELEP